MKTKKLKQNIIGLHNKMVRKKLEAEKKAELKNKNIKQDEKIIEEAKP
jgi:hypothetical protein